MYVLLKTRKAYGVKTEDQGIKQDIYIYMFVVFFHSSRNGLLEVF